MHSNKNFTTTEAGSMAYPIQGKSGTTTLLQGMNFIYLNNPTDQTQKYDLTFSICSAVTEHDVNCAYYSDLIELEPNGYVSSYQMPKLKVEYNKPGSYMTVSQTSVSLLNADKVETVTANSISMADVTIS